MSTLPPMFTQCVRSNIYTTEANLIKTYPHFSLHDKYDARLNVHSETLCCVSMLHMQLIQFPSSRISKGLMTAVKHHSENLKIVHLLGKR